MVEPTNPPETPGSTEHKGNGAERGASGRASLDDEATSRLLALALGRLGDLLGELKILASVRSDRLRLEVRRAAGRLVASLAVWAALFLFAAGGMVLVILGLAGGFRAFFVDRPWLGELAAGALLLALVGAWVLVRRALSERAEVRQSEAKYEELERKRERRVGAEQDEGAHAGRGARAGGVPGSNPPAGGPAGPAS